MPTVTLDVNGTKVQIEHEGPSRQVQAGVAEELEARLDDALELIKKMASSCNKAFDELSDTFSPNQLTISFGLKVDGEANWVIGKLGGEASFQVDFSWQQ